MVTLENTILLLGYNARAQCYAQAMESAGYAPRLVVTFGARDRDVARNVDCPELDRKRFRFTPDLKEPLSETIRRAGWNWTASDAENVNAAEIRSLIAGHDPDVVVYAGYGGQIVGVPLLTAIPSFLHMHCGRLPEYRGSTTIYYSWLRENACGVSAILMNAKIDEGPVLVREDFPPPPPDADVDQFYDNTLRAHVLLTCMDAIAESGSLPPRQTQQGQEETYYVIHPVLKHIALMQTREAH